MSLIQGIGNTLSHVLGLASPSHLAQNIYNWETRPSAPVDNSPGTHSQFPNSAGGTGPVHPNIGAPVNTGGGGGGSYAAPAYDPNTDPTQVNNWMNNVHGDQNTLNNLYNTLNGQVTAYGQDKRNQLESAHNDVLNQNAKSYAGANDQSQGIYTARGASDSSYLGNTLQQNKDSYDQSTKTENNAFDQNEASLGNTLNSVKSQLDASHPQYDLGQYHTVGDLQNLHNSLGDYINKLKGLQNDYLTTGQLKGKLDQIAPSTSNLAGTLKSQIDKIIAGPGDPSAKIGIANTYISQLPANQQDPYKKYLQDQTAPILQSAK